MVELFHEIRNVQSYTIAQDICNLLAEYAGWKKMQSELAVLVLDDGKLVGKGTHQQLLSSCDTYKQIAHSQLSEAELAKSTGGDVNE